MDLDPLPLFWPIYNIPFYLHIAFNTPDPRPICTFCLFVCCRLLVLLLVGLKLSVTLAYIVPYYFSHSSHSCHNIDPISFTRICLNANLQGNFFVVGSVTTWRSRHRARSSLSLPCAHPTTRLDVHLLEFGKKSPLSTHAMRPRISQPASAPASVRPNLVAFRQWIGILSLLL